MESSIIILIAICALSLFTAYKMVPADKYKLIYILLAFGALLLRVVTVLYIYRDGTDLGYKEEGDNASGDNGISHLLHTY